MAFVKKTIISCLFLGSNLTFAGAMGPVCSSNNATFPCSEMAWSFGAKALYLQPSLGSANIHGLQTNASGVDEFVNFNPQYAWGFQIEGAYYFNTGNDLNINWSRVAKSTSHGIGANRTVENVLLSQDSISIDPNWNAVNVEVGQRLDFGDLKSIRFHGGVEYARITTDWSAAGVVAAFPDVVGHPVINRSYNGFGPRAGADLSYGWANGMGVYAKTAGALLVGPQHVTSNFAPNFIHARRATMSAVVPELEAKIGAAYNYPVMQGNLTLDVGWMWINYFDAVLSDHTDAVTSTPVVNTSNFALQGLFFGLKWAGNVA